YYARVGNVEKALELDARAHSQGDNIMYVHYNSALIHAQLGDKEQALVSIKRALELNYERELLRIDPAFEGLRQDERFRQLVTHNSS
ncbi:MAG: hypothetical protein OEV32_15585, partial [Gammaproteobacteria bacterium]|nr:hypothetical protein [Gammaproteobacteria bacterium]